MGPWRPPDGVAGRRFEKKRKGRKGKKYLSPSSRTFPFSPPSSPPPSSPLPSLCPHRHRRLPPLRPSPPTSSASPSSLLRRLLPLPPYSSSDLSQELRLTATPPPLISSLLLYLPSFSLRPSSASRPPSLLLLPAGAAINGHTTAPFLLSSSLSSSLFPSPILRVQAALSSSPPCLRRRELPPMPSPPSQDRVSSTSSLPPSGHASSSFQCRCRLHSPTPSTSLVVSPLLSSTGSYPPRLLLIASAASSPASLRHRPSSISLSRHPSSLLPSPSSPPQPAPR